MTSKERDDLFMRGIDKFTPEEKRRVFQGYGIIKKKVIYHLANNDSIKVGTLDNYREYKNQFEKL
jgi:TfoX/Sxy family transcriptional regulator of competence genes